MPRPSLASALFSLFVPPDRAEEMEGDLIEQSQTNGAAWHALQTVLVAFALMARAFAKAPLSILLIGIAGFAALYAGLLGGELVSFSPVGAWLSAEAGLGELPRRVATLCLTAAPISFLAGFALVRLAPLRGATAALLALVLFGGFLAMLQVNVYPPEMAPTNALKLSFAAIPLLLGAAIAHRGRLSRARFS